MLRTCRKCGAEKPLDQFVPDKNCHHGRTYRCKACHNAKQRAYWHRPEIKERDLERRREWHRRYYRLRLYGVSPEEYETMWAKQGERCALCNGTESGRGFDWNLDHCHTTGRVRGILCHKCNLSLGHYEMLKERCGGEKKLLAYLGL